MDRCAAAYAYHKQGYNCAQSVAGAFADLTGTAPEQLMAAMGGFGGGVGGSHEELCGAVSGGVLVLSLLHPHTDGEDRAGKLTELMMLPSDRYAISSSAAILAQLSSDSGVEAPRWGIAMTPSTPSRSSEGKSVT